jgi:uncharacterized protein (TIGR00369 family)
MPAAILAAAGITEMSPSSRTLGMEILAMDGREGSARVRFQGRPEFVNPAGSVQGGFLSAMLDDVIGMMAMVKAGPKMLAATIDLHVQYLRPVRPGPVEVAARITEKGRAILFAEAELYDLRGKIAAKARASLALTPKREAPAAQDETRNA